MSGILKLDKMWLRVCENFEKFRENSWKNSSKKIYLKSQLEFFWL